MRILRDFLNEGLPPIVETDDGGVNSVLAVWHPSHWNESGSNHYMSPWIVTNTKFYHNHPDHFLGWIELQELKIGEYN
jgi:hypothetical protein